MRCERTLPCRGSTFRWMSWSGPRRECQIFYCWIKEGARLASISRRWNSALSLDCWSCQLGPPYEAGRWTLCRGAHVLCRMSWPLFHKVGRSFERHVCQCPCWTQSAWATTGFAFCGCTLWWTSVSSFVSRFVTTASVASNWSKLRPLPSLDFSLLPYWWSYGWRGIYWSWR